MSSYPDRVLIISSCTNDKYFKPNNALQLEDFKDIKRFKYKEKQLEKYKLPAVEMYTGRQHQYLFEGIKALRNIYGVDSIDLKILSAGYGILDEKDEIVPYNVSFSNMGAEDINEWANHLQISKKIEVFLDNYDLVFFLLGEKYLRALSLPFKANQNTRIIFLTTWSCSRLIPDLPNYWVIGTSSSDATSFGSALVSLKGYLFKLLCLEMASDESLLPKIYEDPNYIHCVLYPHRKEVQLKYLSLFSEKELPSCEEILMDVKQRSNNHTRKFGGFIVKNNELAENYRVGKITKFFIPEWDDRVDPNYDFENDLHKRNGDSPYEHDLYAHEIYPVPNYDGILVSLAVLDSYKKQKMSGIGVHEFLRFPKSYPIMADCGAFNYVDEKEPPFKTEEVLHHYEDSRFDYGVSIDHLIVGDYERDPVIRQYRYELTLQNAKDFIERYNMGDYRFKPIGVAQGWDPLSYRKAVEYLLGLGYEYIALGSLIPKTSRQIYNILKEIAPVIPEYLDLHLFGITRLEGIKAFLQLGATSFDSAAPLRQAWLSARSNYYTLEPGNQDDYNSLNGYKRYSAIRVPFANTKGLTKPSAIDLIDLERNSLKAVRLFEKNKIDLEEVLSAIISYESKSKETYFERIKNNLKNGIGNPVNVKDIEALEEKEVASKKQILIHEKLYREVLRDRPWEKCDCVICKEIGVEVIIFRGNNRNRRRGFHNTYVFNKQFKREIGMSNSDH